ncbi:unnamed protein product [Darwinula stevensoni]|uniref:Uncharacterized protein n=1 Tax=Darwinula stevensoni TaxID=69355 RepID=A0A7R8XCI1_9CRUS|nr:unnamed protein product [Darwinula stevensoni]CAG0893349.1 unnamed protein product [Darwinula stevensoni]
MVALESTPVHGRENTGGKLEEIVLVLKAKTQELAKQVSQLKSENEQLVSLRDDYKILKHDFENIRHATGKLGNDCENMRKEHENLKSSFQEHLLERDKLQLQLNTTEGRLQYLEAISLQITKFMEMWLETFCTTDDGCRNTSHYDESKDDAAAVVP